MSLVLEGTIRKLFEDLDKDGSGRISVAELRDALQSCSDTPLSDASVKAFFEKIDTNKDGQMSLDELLAFLL